MKSADILVAFIARAVQELLLLVLLSQELL
jgi:hypothetical protein